MRRWNHLWAPVAVALVTALGGCGTSETGNVTLEAQFQIQGLSETGDNVYSLQFGDVAIGQKVIRRFNILNRGNSPLEVEPIKGDLNPFNSNLYCVAGQTCENRRVEPGTSIPVSIEFQPVAEASAEKEIKINTNAGAATLQLAGKGAKPDFVCSTPTGEGSSLDFGNMVKGTTATKKVTCENRSNLDAVLQVLDVTGPNADSFEFSIASPDGKILVQGGRSVEIPVTFKALATALFENFATLNIQIEGGTRLAPILLTGRVLEGALEIDPLPDLIDDVNYGPYDFGFVKPGTSKEISITLRNLSNAPLEVQDFSLDPTSDSSFSLTPPPPFTIGGFNPDVPGANEVQAVLRFAPTGVGQRDGQINVVSSDPASPVRAYRVQGFGGGPTVSCTPNSVSFGPTAFGVPRVREIVCTNIADFDDPDTELDRLKIFEPFMEAPVSNFTVRVKNGIRRDGYGVGESFTLVVTFDPKTDGNSTDKVVLKTNDTAHPEFNVSVDGIGRKLDPCVFEIRPNPTSGLRFGNVPPRKKVTLEVAVVNLQDKACLLQDVTIGKGSDPSFKLGYPEGQTVVPFIDLDPNGEVRIPVTYAPIYKTSSAEGELHFQINSASYDDPNKIVKLKGAANDPCLLVAPDNVDFGVVAPNKDDKQCSTRTRTFQVINVCSVPIDITNISVPPGQPSDEFKITKSPFGINGPNIITLAQAGDSTTFEMVYQPKATGEDTGVVWIQTSQLTDPYTAVLHGEGNFTATQTDRFSQQSKPKVDVLWVVSNMNSMSAELKNLQTYASDFWDFAVANEIDFHLGVTTTGTEYDSWSCGAGVGILGLEDGRLVPVEGTRPRVVTPDTPNGFDVFKANLRQDACQYYEGGVYTSYQAVTEPMATSSDDPRYPEKNDGNLGFLRSDALLSIIYFTDGVDTYPSPQKSTTFYYNSILAAKAFDESKLSIHGFINDKDQDGNSQCSSAAGLGTRYREMIQKGGGRQETVCPDDWSLAMRNMASAAFGFRSCFSLTGQPDDADGDGVISDTTVPPELEVRLNGARFEATGSRGNRQWEFDAANNSVCFFPLSTPEPGTGIEMTYQVACIQ